MLIVEQNARAALRLADRGYVLETGRVVLAGPAAELMADPTVQGVYLGQTVAESQDGARAVAVEAEGAEWEVRRAE